jgi:hypothetical protein
MVLGVVGSRDFPDLPLVRGYILDLYELEGAEDHYLTIVSGGAKGVDQEAEKVGHELGLHVISYRPLQTARGPYIIHKWVDGEDTGMWGGRVFSKFASAAFHRNGIIVADCSRLVAFWNGYSRGTQDTIKRAESAGRPLEVIERP